MLASRPVTRWLNVISNLRTGLYWKGEYYLAIIVQRDHIIKHLYKLCACHLLCHYQECQEPSREKTIFIPQCAKSDWAIAADLN